jgi:hypothetical protein
MCIDFTDLNKCCPKDDFPLVRIDQIVDSAAKLKLNPEKCVFGVTRGKVLGCLVSTKRIEASPDKI